MSDDSFRKIHEELADQYLEKHPGIGLQTAYEKTALAAYEEWKHREAEMYGER